ncbi:unnamed protein product [Gongylonema pulchrum]|uniref:Cadherin domain-containing protein n=1 Tax=Gongylonema pulchrum TaxID=637853 RepID=A0A183D0W9_9BILA|nr:unnamed protein product [Gongylonema pulchrum]
MPTSMASTSYAVTLPEPGEDGTVFAYLLLAGVDEARVDVDVRSEAGISAKATVILNVCLFNNVITVAYNALLDTW